jgi:hypothetical protein
MPVAEATPGPEVDGAVVVVDVEEDPDVVVRPDDVVVVRPTVAAGRGEPSLQADSRPITATNTRARRTGANYLALADA